MRRRTLLVWALTGLVLLCVGATSFAADGIIPVQVAAQRGLKRAWLTQVQMDTTRARVAHVLLNNGTLFVQTDKAILHAFNAETGQTLWAEEVGDRRHPSLAPAANDNLVAVINGSRLYVLNRFYGKLLWQTQIDGAPGAGPAMSSQRVYVPITSGIVYSYRLTPEQRSLQDLGKPASAKTPEQQAAEQTERRQAMRLDQALVPPLVCQSTGRTLVQPIVTRQNPGEEYLAWTTDRGYMFVGSVRRQAEDQFAIVYRLQTSAEIVASPAYLPPDPRIVRDSGMIYAASRDGFLHALQEKDGESLWRFPTAEPIVEAPAAIDDRVYVATQPGGMYCLEAKDGKQVWWTPHVTQFLAASKERVYTADKQGQILILNAKTGTLVDTLAVNVPMVRFWNQDTDRLYLVSQKGMIQCLHEIGQTEPIHHLRAKDQVEAPASAKADAEKPATEKKAKPASGGGAFAPARKPAKKAADDEGMDMGFEKPAKKPRKASKKQADAMDDALDGADLGGKKKPKKANKKADF